MSEQRHHVPIPSSGNYSADEYPREVNNHVRVADNPVIIGISYDISKADIILCSKVFYSIPEPSREASDIIGIKYSKPDRRVLSISFSWIGIILFNSSNEGYPVTKIATISDRLLIIAGPKLILYDLYLDVLSSQM